MIYNASTDQPYLSQSDLNHEQNIDREVKHTPFCI